MIKKLERQIMWTIVLILTITTLGIFLTVNITNYQALVKQEFFYLQKQGTTIKKEPRLPEQNGELSPEEKEEELHGYYPLYIAEIANSSVEASVTRLDGSSYTSEQICALALDAAARNERSGTIKNLRYVVKNLPDKTEIIFLESQAKARFLSSLIRSAFYCVCLLLLFLYAARVLARKIVRPVEEAFQKQKRFISDASHELKTPVTIINANIDLLRAEVGENKRMDYIESEGQRMSALIGSLLTLSRMSQEPLPENKNIPQEFRSFDLSAALLGTALSFESVAFERGIAYDVQIDDDISFTGNESQICQAAAILLDNAMKYTAGDGGVRILLNRCGSNGSRGITHSHPRRAICLTVANSGPEISKEDREKIFDRFYRTDESRNRASGGFGLGLSIAKSIAQRHRGEISVSCKDGWTTFTLKLPDNSHSPQHPSKPADPSA
ncbi:MAG: HAMP domain-containing sensor histidine kinase [Eubacteriales bacterium]|nr:HAMP domain-containing sensor histidine kinase [Eubacteriales bacterium]